MSPILLLTKALTPAQETYAAELGLTVHTLELFQTEPLSFSWPEEVGTALFTSVRAVRAISPYLKHLAETPIFCVGSQAGALLRARGLTPTSEGFTSAAQLAAFLLQFPLRLPVVHFCGQDRRNELRDGLVTGGIPLREVPVYERAEAPFPPLPSAYDGVAFVSPRGVARFFEAGPSAAAFAAPCFALGPTTAAALGQLGLRPSATPPKPTLEALLLTAANYLHTHTHA